MIVTTLNHIGRSMWPSMRVAAMLVCLLFPAPAADAADSRIKKDEVVTFFPTYGWRAPDRATWNAAIHGWLYEPEDDSRKREVLLQHFQRALGLEPGDAGTDLFRARARPFLADSERGKRIAIRIGDRTYSLGETRANGHVEGIVRVPADATAGLIHVQGSTDGWVPFHAEARRGDRRKFSGTVQLLEAAGASVLSDIDDTIKVTEVLVRRELLANTFLREFRAVPGMAEAYLRCATAGAAFHYVSASPWQLYEPLSEFLRKTGFPSGSFHMKAFRWKDTNFFNLFAAPDKHKLATIEPILQAFPRRRFIFVGDSGEQDPEIYGALARKYPNQVAAIYIRDVTGEKPESLRYSEAFREIAPERWRIFSTGKELPLTLP